MLSVSGTNPTSDQSRYETWHREPSRGTLVFDLFASTLIGGLVAVGGLALTRMAATSLQQRNIGRVISGAAGLAAMTGMATLFHNVPDAPKVEGFTPPTFEDVEVASKHGVPGSKGPLTGDGAGQLAAYNDSGAIESQLGATFKELLGNVDGYASEAEALAAYGNVRNGSGSPEHSIAIVESNDRYFVYRLNGGALDRRVPRPSEHLERKFDVDEHIVAIEFAGSLYKPDASGKLVEDGVVDTAPGEKGRDREVVNQLKESVADLKVPFMGDPDFVYDYWGPADLGIGYPDLSEAMAALTQYPESDQAAVVHTRDRYFVVNLVRGTNNFFKGSPVEKMEAPLSADLVPAMWNDGRVWYSHDGLWVTQAEGSES